MEKLSEEKGMPEPSWYEEVDHTGDAGIRVAADDLGTLFGRAAWAMFKLVTDPSTVRSTERRTVAVDAADLERLLVRWLSELNFIHITEKMLFREFEVGEISSTHLTAVVSGEPIDLARHPIYTEIKAVTYHALEVTQRDGRWMATVIFDL